MSVLDDRLHPLTLNEIMSIETKESVWVLCETGAGYQPYGWFNRSVWQDSQNTNTYRRVRARILEKCKSL